MNPNQRLTADALNALQEIDTATICNAIDLFDIRGRIDDYADQRLQCHFHELKPMVGYAVTATVRTGTAPDAAHAEFGTFFLKQLDFIQQMGVPAVVVFQDLDEPKGAIFGEGMATAYQAFGTVGIVTNGLCRDLEAVRTQGLACFTGGAVPSKGLIHFEELNVPVTVHGLEINPGDLLHGDSNGVTSIPHQIADKVAKVGQQIIDVEQVFFECARDKSVTLESFRAAREAYAEKLKVLKASLQT